MNIIDNINRLRGAKEALRDAIGSKGVPIPPHTLIDGYAAYVDEIVQGGGNNPFIPLFQGSVRVTRTDSEISVPTTWGGPLLIAGHASNTEGWDHWDEPIYFIICVTDYTDGIEYDIYSFPPIDRNNPCLLTMYTDYTDAGFEHIYFGGSCLLDATVYITGIYKTEVPISQQFNGNLSLKITTEEQPANSEALYGEELSAQLSEEEPPTEQ